MKKGKGSRVTNPNPIRPPKFRESEFKPLGETYGEKLGDKVFGVRLPKSVQDELNEMPQRDRVALIRKAITEAVKSESEK